MNFLGLLNRYIIAYIIKANLFLLVAVLALYFLLNFIVQVDAAGSGSFGVLSVIQYVLFMLPVNCYDIFPIVSLLGSLIGLGLLASHNEITVMRSAGMSVMQVLTSVLFAALLLTIGAVIVGEGIGPSLASSAARMKVIESSEGRAIETHEGVWVRSGDHFIHIARALLHQHEVFGVQDYQVDPKTGKLLQASFASRGVYRDNHWNLEGVSNTKITPTAVTVTHAASQPWPVSIDTKVFNFFNITPVELGLHELHAYIHYQKRSGADIQKAKFIFWKRVFSPLAIIVMIMLATPFMFGSFRQVSMGLRVLVGVGMGLAYFLLSKWVETFSLALHLPAGFSAALPIILFAILAVYLIKRVS